jgi:xylulokinase
VENGSAYCCIGTSAWIASCSDRPVYDAQMRTTNYCHMIPGLYSPNGTMQFAGGAYNWMKNTLCPDAIEAADRSNLPSAYAYMDALAETSPAGANGLLFLPFMLGERAPYWDATAKGCFIGLKPENTRNDMLRSVLEAAAYNLGIVLDIFRSHGIGTGPILALGGGAKGKLWRQILSDVWQTPVAVPNILEEAGSMGAAVNAGVGVGLYKGFDAIEKFISVTDVHQPDADTAEIYARMRGAYEISYEALKGVFERLG